MFLKIIGIFAEFERENIAERIILGRERKVNEGLTLCSHTASYGYDRPNGQKVQTIIESEAQVVKEIFDWYTKQGVNIHEIARRLNLRGVPTKHSSQWTRGGIKNLLVNSNYMGHVRHRFEDEERAYTVEGKHEAIIPKEVFDKAQKMLAKNSHISPTKQPMEENYFTGFLFCAQCGCRLYSHNLFRTWKDGTVHFLGNYGCGNTKVGVCKASEMSARKLEQAFQAYIAGIAEFEVDNTIELRKQEQEKQERQALIATHEDKLRQLEAKGREALDFYVSNIFSVEEYRRVKRRLDDDKQTLCAELERLQVEAEEIVDNRIEIAKSFHENWAGFSFSEKRMFLMQFVEKIIVENEKIGETKGRAKRKVKIFDIVFKEN